MADREFILAALPEASGPVLPAVYDRGRKPANDLWLEFEEQLVALGGQMVPSQALPMLLSRDKGYWADEDVLPLLPAGGNHTASIWDAELGVCLADYAVAETGTLLIAAGPGRARLASLAPPVNIVLVRESDILATPDEAFARLPANTTVLVSGTSRTADIEGILVRGVHGPRELYVVKIS
jgi:hypothetical protein